MKNNFGFGLGLRATHYDYILENKPLVDWFEIITENYIDNHAGYLEFLTTLRETYPIVMHGVGMGIGGTEPLNKSYLEKIQKLASHIKAPWVSDHLCFTGAHGYHSHDLLPIPYTEESVKHVAQRILQVQHKLECPFALENPSTYIGYQESTYTEWEFLGRLIEETGVSILLDVNNIYVSSRNFGWDAKEYIDAIPSEAILQIHLAGHEDRGDYVIDTHDNFVVDPVWDLYAYTIHTKGMIPTMIEWDEAIPEFPVLFEELNKAKNIAFGKDTRYAIQKIG